MSASEWANAWFDFGIAVATLGVACWGWSLALHLAHLHVQRRHPLASGDTTTGQPLTVHVHDGGTLNLNTTRRE